MRKYGWSNGWAGARRILLSCPAVLLFLLLPIDAHAQDNTCGLFQPCDDPQQVCVVLEGLCRHNPGRVGQICGVADPCASDLQCISQRCVARAGAGQRCNPLDRDSCQSGLVCDAGSSLCRNDPPLIGQTCGVLVPCAGDLTCIAATCRARAGSGETCDRVVANSCQDGLVCDAGSGTCRSPAPELGETCGVLVPCAGDLTCIAATCRERAGSGETCDRVVANSCQDGLVCDAGSGTCRSPAPELGETCGVLVPCAGDLTCIAATCRERAAAGETCDRVVANSCQDGLVCDIGDGRCRHDPPLLGETCGIAVPCAEELTCIGATCRPRAESGETCDRLVANSCRDGLTCDAGSGTCRSPVPELGETCGVLAPCAGDLTCIAATCRERAASGETCDRVVENSCRDGLVCDAGSGTCRRPTPELGETCGLAVPCAEGLTCIAATCRERATVGESCDRVVANSCRDGLVCDAFDGRCRNDPPLFGQRCGPLVPCGEGVCDASGECRHVIPELGEPCGVGVACDSGLTCAAAVGVAGRCVIPGAAGEACTGQGRGSCENGLVCDISGVCRSTPPRRGEPCGELVSCRAPLVCDDVVGGRCDDPAKVGESCAGLGQGNCESGATCVVNLENGSFVSRCFPADSGPIPPESCALFRSEAISALTRDLGIATTYGYGSGGGAGAAASTEVGVVYGPGGEYGCYTTGCAGVLSNAGVSSSACIGAYESYGAVAGDSVVTVESVSPSPDGILSFSTAQAFSSIRGEPQAFIGTADCLSIGVSALPLDIGAYRCTTQVADAPFDSNGDGLPDVRAARFGLDPTVGDADSDGDGVSDVAELGADPDEPLDSDGDGAIDALEAGSNASSARVAEGIPLPGGGSVSVATATGELLTSVGASAGASVPDGVDVALGVISYSSTAPVGGTLGFELTFSEPLPEDVQLFTVDHTGTYTDLPDSAWEVVGPNTVVVRLQDGDPLTDLDGLADGLVEQQVAAGRGQAPPSGSGGNGSVLEDGSSASGGGGGGGCSVAGAGRRDLAFPGVLLGLLGWRSLRRRRGVARSRRW